MGIYFSEAKHGNKVTMYSEQEETQRNQCIITGFIRRQDFDFNLVPMDIMTLTVLYFRDHDQWNGLTTSALISIDDKLISTGHTGWPYHTAFGCDDICFPKVKKWQLTIPSESDDKGGAVWSVIGIIESTNVHPNMTGNFYDPQNNGYGLKGFDGCLFHGSNKPFDKAIYSPLYKGDNIAVILDMGQGTLRYIINGKEHRIAFDIDKTKSYTLCVALSKNSKLILHK